MTMRGCGAQEGASRLARLLRKGSLKDSASAGPRRQEGHFGQGGCRQGQRHKVGSGKGAEFTDRGPTEWWVTGGTDGWEGWLGADRQGLTGQAQSLQAAGSRREFPAVGE